MPVWRNRRLSDIHSIEDFRRAARRSLPKMIFDFVDGGSQTESTVRENIAAIERIRLVPSGPIDVSNRAQSVSIFGSPSAMPIIIGPTGLAAAFWPRGDIALASAAARYGIPFVMSTNANASLQDVSRASQGRKWFQLYMRPSREATAGLLDKVRKAGFETLQITVDTAVASRRYRDMRNGFSAPIKWTPRKVLDVMSAPGWLTRVLRYGPPKPALLHEAEMAEVGASSLSEMVNRILDPKMDWDDLAWLRDQWKGPLIAKGICDPKQAERAVSVGYDGIVVSNHGGRQLDGAVASIDALRDVADSVGSKITILVDGGFRTGSDIIKALALGATAVQLGRPTIYALATAGEAGVCHALDLLKAEIDVAQALCGLTDLSKVDRNRIHTPRT